MKPTSLTFIKDPEFGIKVATIALFLFIFRMAIPVFKYPFFILYAGIVVFSFTFYFKQIQNSIRKFIVGFILIFILFIVLFISFIFSNKIYLIEFKDIINGFILISLFFILTLFVTDKERLKFLSEYMVSVIPVFALVISIVGLLYFFDILTHKDFLFNNTITELRKNESSLLDYNFSLLPVFFGFISVLFLTTKIKKILPRLVSGLLLLLFSFQIFTSGSRRGLIIFFLILFILMISLIFTDKNKSTLLKLIAAESVIFLVLLVIILFSGYLLIIKTPYGFKNRFLEFIGSKNIFITKNKIAKQILRYTSIIDKSSDFQQTYNVLWSTVFNPEDPDSGWGSRIHNTIYPLTGKNFEIVPPGSKGYQMDWTCDATYYKTIDLSESYSLLTVIDAMEGDSVSSSVFCYLSDDFDGNSVALTVSSIAILGNLVSGKYNSFYDTNKRGEWQKLQINFVAKEAQIPIYMSFIKQGVSDFTKLKGRIIFAYPQFKKISKSEIIQSVSLNQQNRSGCVNSLPVQLKTSTDHIKYYSSDMFGFHLSEMIKTDTLLKRSDPVRTFVAKIISEDTTYYGYKSNLLVDTKLNKYGDERLVRWIFALHIFTREYTMMQQFFGGGFNFLNWYGFYFMKDKTSSDWPHNPFLSILLYSGILGFLIYCYFIYKVFYYYIKYIKEYPLLFIFFLITFFFSFFSGGSPFDPPIMGFFVILPFLIHSIHKKDLTEKSDP